MNVSEGWVQGQMAVNRFDALCIERKWPFVPTPADRDFGKDGYVDVSDGGTITGQCFFVQIKGGRSFVASGGYRIPVGKHLAVWRDAPAAVIGIVHDPHDDRLRWVNLTLALRDDPTAASVFVEAEAVLDDDHQIELLLRSANSTVVDRYVPLGLGSRATADQGEAVWDAFAMGHQHAAPLIAVRRALFAFDPTAASDAIYALSHCTPHPDIPWSGRNWLPPPIQNQVAATFRWSFHEVWQLLTFVDGEEGMRRGTLGQCVYMLLVEDPDVVRQLDRVVATGDEEWVLSWAAALRLHLVGDAAATVLAQLIEIRSDLLRCPLGEQITEAITRFGWVSLMD